LVGSQARSLNLSTFTILGYEKCLACGAISERAAPLWAWGTGIAIGTAIIALFVVWFVSAAASGSLLLSAMPITGAIVIIGSARGFIRRLNALRRAPVDKAMPTPVSLPGLTTSPLQPDAHISQPCTAGVAEYACVFKGWIPSNATRAKLAGAGRVLLTTETIRIESRDGKSNYTIGTRNTRAFYHPVTNSFCVAIDGQQWIAFCVSGRATPAQPLAEARFQELLGPRFGIWTRPETTPASWGSLAAAIFAFPLLAIVVGAALWNSDSRYSEATVHFWVIFEIVLSTVISAFFGVMVVRRTLRASARARELESSA